MVAISINREAGSLARARQRPRALALWLTAIAAMVLAIVVIGGITRLTESGLSITQWDVVSGVLPPLNEAEWQAEYAKYRQTPEYIYEAGPAGMTLADFKFVYFWEWFHRLLARLLGVAFAVPLAWFWLRGAIPRGYHARLLALLALGGLQGAIGWLMVRSGLTGEMTDVSHFRLSLHLLIALFTLGGLVWTALDLRELAKTGENAPARFTALALTASLVLFVQLLLGAWVAGLNAGLASNSWPLMQGRLAPEVDWSQGVFRIFTHDPFWLHFLHRWWAFVAVIALVIVARADTRLGHPLIARALYALLAVQMLLGIATVMTGVSLWLAVLHQFVGAVLVAAFAWGAHVLGRAA